MKQFNHTSREEYHQTSRPVVRPLASASTGSFPLSHGAVKSLQAPRLRSVGSFGRALRFSTWVSKRSTALSAQNTAGVGMGTCAGRPHCLFKAPPAFTQIHQTRCHTVMHGTWVRSFFDDGSKVARSVLNDLSTGVREHLEQPA